MRTLELDTLELDIWGSCTLHHEVEGKRAVAAFEAQELYERSAAAGHHFAQNNLGFHDLHVLTSESFLFT